MSHNELYEAVKTGNADRVENLLQRPGKSLKINMICSHVPYCTVCVHVYEVVGYSN